jgi:drug/metabolite transporter (DMT)-like permease
LSPTQVVAGRMLFGALALVVAAKLGFAAFPSTRREWRLVTTLSLIQNVLPFALFAWGEQRISSSAATMMNATTPLWTAVIAAVALLPGEQMNRRRIGALLAGLAGVLVIVEPWQNGVGGQVIGDVACLGAAACYGVGFVFTSRKILGTMPARAAAVGQIVSGAPIALLIGIVATVVSHDTPHVDLHIAGAMLMLGALGTGIAFLLSFHLQEKTGPTATSAVTFLMPFVGVVLGVAVLDEKVGWNVALGGALVLVSAIRVRPKRVVVAQLSEA